MARAGRTGNAHSLVSSDEVPYMIDLHLFLGRSLVLAGGVGGSLSGGAFGSVPRSVVDSEEEFLQKIHSFDPDLVSCLSFSCHESFI